MPITFSDTTVSIDIEGHSVHERFDLPPERFFRLGQWSFGDDGPIHTTTDLEEFRAVIRSASLVIGHNITGFDLPSVFGMGSIEPVTMARGRKVLDTLVHATVAMPPPFDGYVNAKGQAMKCDGPSQFRRWYSLANLSHQLGLDGKLLDLSDLADEFGHVWEPTYSEKTGRRLKHDKKVKIEGLCCPYSAIPVDDERFVEYAKMDVVAARELARALLGRHGWSEYSQWEQVKAAIAAQVTRNGLAVDQPLARAKERVQLEEAAYTLHWLNEEFGFPLKGKKPLATIPGKEALSEALVSVGVKIKDLAKTANGNPSFGADSVKAAAEKVGKPKIKLVDDGSDRLAEVVIEQGFDNGPALALADAVGTLAGQRSIPQLALASVYEDGRVHPSIMALQRSRRFSTTEPGLTVTSPDHKDLYVADSDDDLLVVFDYSNADARAVAALSGDREFAKRFLPGADGHMINALAAWGPEVVATDPSGYRQRAKAPGHGWGYKIGARKLTLTTGIPEPEAKDFLTALNRKYPGVVAWQDQVAKFARMHGYVVNDWGTRLVTEPGREVTQGPALLGQNATHELLLEGCVRLPDRLLRRLKLTIHDAVMLSLAKATLDRDIELVIQCFSRTWHPKGGQAIDFTLSHSAPARTWKDADNH